MLGAGELLQQVSGSQTRSQRSSIDDGEAFRQDLAVHPGQQAHRAGKTTEYAV